MQHISLLIKPASGNCNLRCKYCFYHDVAKNRQTVNYGMMSEEILEILVKKAFEEAEKGCTFAFQGGEPTLAGLSFYEKLITFQKKYNQKNIAVQNSIQTNGLVIDDKWAAFLAENKFLVGISIDGDKRVHDMHRTDAKGEGSFQQVMRATKLFEQYKVEYNILCVVTNHVAKHINQIYNFYKKNHFRYLQFIPCLDPLGEKRGQNPYSLTADRYAYFLKTLFDRWYEDIKRDDYYSIRQFDEYVHMIMGYPPQSCGMSGVCSCYFVVEADGSVYPCDFYVLDEWRMGNIKTDRFIDMQQHENASRFVELSLHIDEKCKTCKVAPICRGGCRRDREPFENDVPARNYFCDAYQEFFLYAGNSLKEIAKFCKTMRM